jgi:class 3 adenylate cyclase
MDRSGGRVIKYMGDGAMLCWPPQRADDALASLVALRAEVKAWAAAEGWETALIVRLHCGTVIAGDFGPAGHAQFDLLGNAVAVAARLQAQTISVSADAFRRLSPESRQLLKKHTPPVVYIPLNDPRP